MESDNPNVSKHNPFLDFLLALVAVLLIVGAVYLALGFFIDRAVDFAPDKIDTALQEVVKKIRRNAEVRTNPKINDLLDKLRIHADIPHQFQVELSCQNEPNAYILPGNLIFLNTGLLRTLETENALAFVLAHEMGHAVHRHHLKMMASAFTWSMLQALIGVELGGEVVSFASGAASLSHSRHAESEADQFALSLLPKIYGHLQGAEEFFKYVLEKQRQAGQNKNVSTFLSTHPATVDRLNAIQKEATKYKIAETIGLAKEFQEGCD